MLPIFMQSQTQPIKQAFICFILAQKFKHEKEEEEQDEKEMAKSLE